LRLGIAKEHGDAYLAYHRTIGIINEALEQRLRGRGSTRKTRAGRITEKNLDIEWSIDSYDHVREEDAFVPSARDLLLPVAESCEVLLSDSLMPDEKPTDFTSKQQRDLTASQVGEGRNRVLIWRHFWGSTLTIQFSFLSTTPQVLFRMNRLLRGLMNGILLFITSLASSIAWIVSDGVVLSLISLVSYAIGWIVIIDFVFVFKHLAPKARRKSQVVSSPEIGVFLDQHGL